MGGEEAIAFFTLGREKNYLAVEGLTVFQKNPPGLSRRKAVKVWFGNQSFEDGGGQVGENDGVTARGDIDPRSEAVSGKDDGIDRTNQGETIESMFVLFDRFNGDVQFALGDFFFGFFVFGFGDGELSG